ncbi:hypothetical protein D9M68_837870 [compost metagenome]
MYSRVGARRGWDGRPTGAGRRRSAPGAELFLALQRGEQFVVDLGVALAQLDRARGVARVDGAAVEFEHLADALLLGFEGFDLRRQGFEFALLRV